MRVWVLGTGSSGNALVVDAGETRIWLDAGIGPKNASIRMRSLGGDLFPRGIDGIVVTHEHGDHAAQLESLGRAFSLTKRDHGEPRIHLHEGIDGIPAARVRHRFATARFDLGRPLTIGAIVVEAVAIVHDAPQVAIRVSSGGVSFGYATDLGSISNGLAAFLASCDTILLEANYCPLLLSESAYPLKLKRRIASATGHLSNEQAGELVGQIAKLGRPRVVLCHLSRENNEPELARKVVQSASRECTVSVLGHGEPRVLDIVRSPSRAAKQLSLPL